MVVVGAAPPILAFLKQMLPCAHSFLTLALTAKTTDTVTLAKMLAVFGARMENAELLETLLVALLLLKETAMPSVDSTQTVILATL
jgi:hypothetical protein